MNLFSFWRYCVLTFLGSHVLTFSLPYVLARQIFLLSASLFERRAGYLFPFFGYVVYSNHVSVTSWLFLHFLPVNSPLSNVIKTSLQCHPCLRPPPPSGRKAKRRILLENSSRGSILDFKPVPHWRRDHKCEHKELMR